MLHKGNDGAPLRITLIAVSQNYGHGGLNMCLTI